MVRGPRDSRFLGAVVLIALAASCGNEASSKSSTDLEGRVSEIEQDVDELSAEIDDLVEQMTLPGGLSTSSDGTMVENSQASSELPKGTSGSRTNPVPLGITADVGDGWTVQINNVNTDATQLILDHWSYNDPPRTGHSFVLVNVTVAYRGPEEKSSSGVSFSAIGPNKVEITENEALLIVPDALPTLIDVFAGGEVRGNVVFMVPQEGLEELVLYSRARLSFDDQDVYFATK